MNQDNWRRFAQQLQRVSAGGGGPTKGFFAGSGLLLALVGGGLALNASLFNGAHIPSFALEPFFLAEVRPAVYS